VPEGTENPPNDPSVDDLLERARRLRQDSVELVRRLEQLLLELNERRAIQFDSALRQLEGRERRPE